MKMKIKEAFIVHRIQENIFFSEMSKEPLKMVKVKISNINHLNLNQSLVSLNESKKNSMKNQLCILFHHIPKDG